MIEMIKEIPNGVFPTMLTPFTDDNKVMAGGAGGIDVIVSAMKTHSNNAGVCYYGCGALINITANNGTSQQHTS